MEIRRSVMGRPNLSERSTRLAVGSWLKCVSATRSFSGKKKAGGRPSAFPFQWLLTKPGGAGVSTRTLGTVFPPQNLEPQSWPGMRRKTFPRRPATGIPRGADGRKLPDIIDRGSGKRVSRFQCLFDGGFGERGHDLVSGLAGVQAVFGEVFFQQAFVIHHGAEVVEVLASGLFTVIPEPVIEFENFGGRAEGVHIPRLGRVVVDRKHRGVDDGDMVGAS